MPSLANQNVYKDDGATTITYTAISPSGGNRQSPALWQALTVGGTPLTHPAFTHYSEANGTGTVRRSVGKLVYPVAQVTPDTGGDVESVASRVTVEVIVQKPLNVTDEIANEAVAQALGLCMAFKEGFQRTSNFV